MRVTFRDAFIETQRTMHFITSWVGACCLCCGIALNGSNDHLWECIKVEAVEASTRSRAHVFMPKTEFFDIVDTHFLHKYYAPALNAQGVSFIPCCFFFFANLFAVRACVVLFVSSTLSDNPHRSIDGRRWYTLYTRTPCTKLF